MPQEYHAEIIQQIIDFNLTSKQIEELCESGTQNDSDIDEITKEGLPATVVKLAKLSKATTMTSASELAHAFLKQEGNLELAHARLKALQRLLVETEQYLASQ